MFGIPMSPTMYLAIALGVVILISGAYFKYSQWQLEKKTVEITALKVSVESQKKAIAQMAADAKLVEEITTSLTEIERANANRATALATTLTKLDKAAIAKPVLVEGLINKASLERNRCLALVTGAPKMKKEVNKVCPQVLDRK